MARPRVPRYIQGKPKAYFFGPKDYSPTSGSVIKLGLDEWEAIRLHQALTLGQDEAAQQMQISQSTFQRILDSANKKIGQALAEGKAIKIITS